LLFERVAGLGDKLACILFQLPPRWHVNEERLREFLAQLPRRHRYTFEFRNHDWFCEPVYAALREYNASLCLYDLAGWKSPEELTSDDFVYVRLHGPVSAYRGQYSDSVIGKWADKIAAWTEGGRDVYIYFDNDEKAFAPHDALRLLGALTASSTS
jgi:uncharacterized protein YecE (DUF72 family)